ncbi:MAG TPA: hypothetical protein VFT66_22530 [Roseiflexaceae bacterium]|jgi:methylthioribose-1-phosphate isomerase|nr:hypothetical protein [Roseiflexaceae bacterium]
MMTLTNLRELLRYDHEPGVLRVRDLARLPEERFTELRTVEAVADALGESMYSSTVLSLLAGYGLALAARAWQGRQPDARRAAMIQASEQLRTARPSIAEARMLDAALQRADAAVFAGEDAERAVIHVVDEALRQAGRAAERCGRRAAELLQDEDTIVIAGPIGPTWWWMLHSARQAHKQVRLVVDGAPASQLVTQQAQQLGVTVVPFETTTASAWNIVMIEAEQIARDGSVAAPHHARQYAEVARQHNVPCYVLCAVGPDTDASTNADLFTFPSIDIIFPQFISAIVTDRGIYRPAMITRYFDDGNAPLDVIPLM